VSFKSGNQFGYGETHRLGQVNEHKKRRAGQSALQKAHIGSIYRCIEREFDCDLLAAILACLRLSPNAIATGCRSDAFLRLRGVAGFWVVAIDATMRQCRLNYDGVNTALICENIYCRINAAKIFVNYSRPNRDDFKIKTSRLRLQRRSPVIF
jgi:hypothetical protein